LTKGFVFINIGVRCRPPFLNHTGELIARGWQNPNQATFVIIIVLLATTGRSNMQPASYVFGNINNRAFLVL
jgi:hypothetical protein